MNIIQSPDSLHLAESIIDFACASGSKRVSAISNKLTQVGIAFEDSSFIGECIDPASGKIQSLGKWFPAHCLDKIFDVWGINSDKHEWSLFAGADFFRVPSLGLFNGIAREERPLQKPTRDKVEPNLEQYAGQDFIYFIRAKALGFIKIGYSSNVAKRIKSLDTGSPDTLELIKVIPGGQEMEHKIHQFFDDIRVKGEWFQPAPELLNYIEKL